MLGQLTVAMALVSGLLAGAVVAADATAKDAEKLVDRALEATLAGDDERREALLAEALKSSPGDPKAHWQLGHVRLDGKWQSANDAAKALATDGRYAEYRKLREAQWNSANGQLLLARWCQKHGLTEEATLHWRGVLAFEPNHTEAIKALGLHKFRGAWLTQEQIDRWKAQEGQFEKIREQWKPRLERWAETIEHDQADKEEALAQLRGVEDPDAIYWLEKCVSPRTAELATEVVGIVARMQTQRGIDSLVRHALASEFAEARQAAAKALRECPQDSFVGPLVESLTAPPEVKSTTLVVRGSPLSAMANAYNQRNVVFIERMGHSEEFDDVVSLTGGKTVTYNIRNQRTSVADARIDDDDLKQAARRERALAQQLARLEALNIRICELLQAVTGLEFGRDQKQWWKWWIEHNEQHVSSVKPKYEVNTAYANPSKVNYRVTIKSCFVETTPVHTRTGPVAISGIRPGDFVLCRQVETGELGYRPVLETTVRPAEKTLIVKAGKDEIECTLGHPFFVVGQGWKMAKELRVGDRLQCLSGAATVLEVEEVQKEVSTYNLVIADFQDYFVGQEALLVHDNTSRMPSPVVPGLQSRD